MPTVPEALGETPRLCAPPDPQPGLPRTWEAGTQVSTYSTVNMRDGNVITTIPIIGWTGTGPDLEFVLYHNSGAVDEQ